ncbi:MAG: DNA internalization-related competence protein ComEC/Rec2 [Melioribacteraceae bacterium]
MINTPLNRFVILFIIGIILEKVFEINFYGLLFIETVLLILFLIQFKKEPNSKKTFALQIPLIILTGSIFYYNFILPQSIYPFKETKVIKSQVEAEITNIDLIRDKRITLCLSAIKVFPFDEISKPINVIANIYGENEELIKLYNNINIGDSIRIRGKFSKPNTARNPGEFEYSEYLVANNITALISTEDLISIKIKNNKTDFFQNAILDIRKSIDYRIKELHSPDAAALLRGFLLADRYLITYDTQQEFIDTGVFHILAVSGMNVAYVILIIYFLFGRFGLKVRLIVSLAAVVAFVIVTGTAPSIIRAAIMMGAFILSLLLGRNKNNFNSLFIAAFIIILINPNDLFSAAFQLSFGAVFSILVYNKYLPIKNKVLSFIGITLAAQIGTLPIIIYYFNNISLISIFANMIVVPVSGLIYLLGTTTVIFSYFSMQLADIIAIANNYYTFIMLWVIEKTAAIAFANLMVYNFSIAKIILFALFFICGIVLLKSHVKNIIPRILVIILFSANFLIISSFFENKLLDDGKLYVMAIDVGQGDSFLIQFPNGKHALIDAGNASLYIDNGERVIKPLLKFLDIEKIDFLFITHYDYDHFGGSISLIKNSLVSEIYIPDLDSSDQLSIKAFDYFKSQNIPISFNNKKKLKIGDVNLYLLNNSLQFRDSVSNDKSLVMKLVYGKNSFLFTGDASMRLEQELISEYGEFLKADILKVAHHGSGSSSSINFINAVAPSFGIISAGEKNIYNHPNKQVLEKFANLGIKLFRTDQIGAVILESDGNTINLINWRTNYSKSILK